MKGAFFSRIAAWTIITFLALSLIPTVSAHEGTVHSGIPHWSLLAVTIGGLGIVGIGVFLDRGRWNGHPELTVTAVLVGIVVAMLGTIGIIQIQIEPIGSAPVLHEWYPYLAGAAGLVVVTGSLVLGWERWPDRPRYALLGMLLGLWVLYPVLVLGAGYWHPIGYLLVVAVPIVVGYILWRDVRAAISQDVIDPLSRRVGLIIGGLFTVFFLFSAGLFSVNPEEGVNAPTTAFLTVASFANPLVVWPAVEFYLPSIPLVGALSVGTAIVIGLLAGLIGLNTALVATVWQRNIALDSSSSVFGALATTGATACCCCGPAVYAIASVFLGMTASPLYWAFIDPSSPVGALFFVGAVGLLTGSSIQLVDRLDSAGICSVKTRAD